MRFHILLVLCCIFVITNGDIVFPCTTPDGEDAHCISLFECPHIRKLVGSSNLSTINFVKESSCGDLMVCCGTPKYETEIRNQTEVQHTPSATPITITIGNKEPTSSISTNKTEKFKRKQSHSDARKLLPTLEYCGLQHTDDRFYTSNDTALDEFPWLVHISLSGVGDDDDDVDRCTGVLISNRYVLTGGFCGSEVFAVKLGQYATNTSFICIEEDPNIPECSDPTIKVRIQERIQFPAPRYEFSGQYTVWLLRLTKKVQWSDFIRPICLPLDETNRLTKIDSLVFSGWGGYRMAPQEVIKKRLTYDVVDAEVCYKALEEHVLLANPNVSFICVSPQKNNTNTACFEERGAPFMYSQRHQWFLEGLVIDADPNCGKGTPVGGVRITPDIINWILDTIRP